MPVKHEVFFMGRNRAIRLVFSDETGPLPFDAVTKMQLILTHINDNGTAINDGTADTVIESLLEDPVIDWRPGIDDPINDVGAIDFNLGELDVAAVTYRAVLMVYDVDHPDGQPLTHERLATDLQLLGVKL